MSRWVRVVGTDELLEGRGVGGLVGDECVAVFRRTTGMPWAAGSTRTAGPT